jgi:hypothetical protein
MDALSSLVRSMTYRHMPLISIPKKNGSTPVASKETPRSYAKPSSAIYRHGIDEAIGKMQAPVISQRSSVAGRHIVC